MKNCCVPVPNEQKKLLKVLTCLYENYIKNLTPSTDTYFSNPNTTTYAAMAVELSAINTLINSNLIANKIFVDASGNNVVVANIWTSNAEGILQYNTEVTAETNAFENAYSGAIPLNTNIHDTGVLKPVQNLNMDDCVNKTYQVTAIPTFPVSPTSPVFVTQALLVERIGCAGVSNLGFLGISLQVPLAYAPFNNCYVSNC